MAIVKKAPAILILGARSLSTAQRIQSALIDAEIHGFASRIEGVDFLFDDFGETLRRLYKTGRPIIALCAAGIIIRSLSTLLQDKSSEPPVLAVAEDGSAVVPLLGGLNGVNVLAREIGAALGVAPAITTTGEIRFGTCLLNPPDEYVLHNPADGKTFIADLLAGAKMRIEGEAPWFDGANLPIDKEGALTARITHQSVEPGKGELLFHPRNIVIAISSPTSELSKLIRKTLSQKQLSIHSLALLLAREEDFANPHITAAAKELNVSLRFVFATSSEAMALAAVNAPIASFNTDQLSIAVARAPSNISKIGRERGRLAIVGLGPGEASMMIPAVRREIELAEDILGYENYVQMAGPFRSDQMIYASDNREEIARARHGFELATQGRSVVIISSGDPGIFAMAAAVMETLDNGEKPEWHGVDLVVLPGVSAAMATAARVGAPLGHDFCVISLSDNLKPWQTILDRLNHAARADLAIALYNPISKARPWQFDEALTLLLKQRSAEAIVVLGRDVGRPAEKISHTTLGELRSDMIDSRTVVIVGSSLTKIIPRPDGKAWVYTPRWYK